MALDQNIPLGACSVVFDGTANGADAAVNIDITLKDEDTVFSSETSVFEVMVDQLDGAYIAQHISGDNPASFTCSVLLRPSDLPNLSSAYVKHSTADSIGYSPIAKNVMYGTIEIHPLANGTDKSYDFIGKKVSCSVNVSGNFKSEDLVRAELVFNFSADDKSGSPSYGLTYTIGAWT